MPRLVFGRIITIEIVRIRLRIFVFDAKTTNQVNPLSPKKLHGNHMMTS